MKRSIK